MSWIKKMYWHLMRVVLILMATFLLGEVVFQIFSPQLPLQFTPQRIQQEFWTESNIVEATLKKSHKSRFIQSASSFDSVVETNSLGWRDAEPDNRDKVLVVGDSFTFGHGVNNDQTIPYHLEKSYGFKYDFVNLGYVAGISPDSYAAYIRSHKQLQGRPTILMLYINDWHDMQNNKCVTSDGITIQSPGGDCNRIMGANTTIISGRMAHNPGFIVNNLPASIIYYLKQSYMVGVIRTIYSQFSENTREITAIESTNSISPLEKSRLFDLLDDIDGLSGNLIIVMLSYDMKNQFYGAVEMYCDANRNIKCLGISPVDSKKHFKNDLHFNHFGTKYIANIIRKELDNGNFFDK